MRTFISLVIVAFVSFTEGIFFWDVDSMGPHLLGELITVMKLMDYVTPYTYQDVCEEYVQSQENIKNLTDARIGTGNISEWKEAMDELDQMVEGVCLKNGSLDACATLMIDCGDEFEAASQSIEQRHLGRACKDVKLFNDCVDSAAQACPKGRLIQMKEDETDLAVGAFGVGCELDCNETMTACTYALEFATDKEFCKSYRTGEECLQRMRTNANCEAEKHQVYLDDAVALRTNSHRSQCNGGTVYHTRILLLALIHLFVSFSTRLD